MAGLTVVGMVYPGYSRVAYTGWYSRVAYTRVYLGGSPTRVSSQKGFLLGSPLRRVSSKVRGLSLRVNVSNVLLVQNPSLCRV